MITYRTATTGTTYADAEQQAYAQARAFFGEDRPFHATSAHAVQETVRHGTYADLRDETVPTVVEVEWEFQAEEGL